MSAKNDEFLEKQIAQHLKPGERALYRAMVSRVPEIFPMILLCISCMVVVGIPVLLYMFTMAPAGKRWGEYYAVLTDRRLLLIRAKLDGGKQVFAWLEEFARSTIQKVSSGGFANNRAVTFHLSDGTEQKFRMPAWPERVTGHTAFLKEMPERFNAGQLTA